nr:DUF3857 domain-containing protein [uncultured Chitinophaga sp.]
MKKTVCSFILLILFPFGLMAGDYEKAWEAIHKNDVVTATTYLQKAIKAGGPQKNSAIATLILLNNMTGFDRDFTTRYFNPLQQLNGPAPYTYALWFFEPVLGSYGLKKGVQLQNLEKVLSDTANFNGSLNAAAAYFMGMHQLVSKRMDLTQSLFSRVGALEKWAFTGPFDNLMGSGFDKDFGPVGKPEGGAFISSSNNSPVNWFEPLFTTGQGWSYVGAYFPVNNAVGYAQTFVNAPADMEPLLCLGGTGALKVWVNDKLMISQPEEKVTELDWWKTKVRLKKGYNRILVQIGFTKQNIRPNYIVRLTDNDYKAVKGLVCQASPAPYQPDTRKDEPVLIPHFAETYFKKQLADHPQDPINAVLLSRVYIRNQEWDKAKTALAKFYKAYPKDAFITNYYSDCMSGSNDRTGFAEAVESFKTLLPDNYWTLYAKVVKLEEEKSYAEALEMLNKLVSMQGEQRVTTVKKMQLLAAQGKIDSMVQLLKQAYATYPDDEELVQTMYQYEASMNNDPAAALKVLESYCNRQYGYSTASFLANVYLNQGKTAAAVNQMKQLIQVAPYELEEYGKLIKYYFASQQYDSAIHYLNIQRQISPYYHLPLGDMGHCYLQKKETDSAILYFRKALALYAGGFDYREQLRMLENKPQVDKYFPALDYYKEIEKYVQQPHDSSHAYAFIFDEKNVIVYPEGAGEQTFNTAIFINNKKGIDHWKEISIPYNSVYQTVSIVKAEVIKPGGAKIPAETDENQLVFTKLNEGDVIYYSYKVKSSGSGRLGREYWDKFYFADFVPVNISSYNLLIADTMPLNYEYVNGGNVKPKITQHEKFKLYSWREDNIRPLRNESYMPSINDVGKVLHLSTVKDWDVIAEWYSDITREQSKEDFEINEAFRELFPAGTSGLDDLTKARKIYEYIEKNISYSSVSFRQGAYVPQKAGKTLLTKLGDCKDLSTLFLAFARKAGLPANLILVSTRRYGQRNMELPSLDFNHCIISFKANNKTYYQELTDNTLPFNALPGRLVGAQVLNIPYEYKAGEKITTLPLDNFMVNVIRRSMDVTLEDNSLRAKSSCAYIGEMAAAMRNTYQHATSEETRDAIQNNISSSFKKQVVLDSLSFRNLGNLSDTVWLDTYFTVKDEVISVGDFSMIRPTFMDVVATANIFTPVPRQHPFEYADYESIEDYYTDLAVHLPAGKKFEQVPSGTNLRLNNMNYTLDFKKVGDNNLIISRRFNTKSNTTIAPGAFKELETFFNGIIKEEQKYISFK